MKKLTQPKSVSTTSNLTKIDASSFLFPQLTPSSSFTKDLGLDSLDAVEVVMAIEEVRILPCRNLIIYVVMIFRSLLLKFLTSRLMRFKRLLKVHFFTRSAFGISR